MIQGIAHVCMGCASLAEVERFYCRALGFAKRFEFVKNGSVIGVYIEVAPRIFLEFFRADEVPRHGSPIRHICLETDDIDDVIARLRRHGYRVGDKKVGSDQTWQAWAENAPDGVAIEFHQYTPDSHQFSGKPCEVNW